MNGRTTVDLNLRRGPGTSSSVIRLLPKGTGVEIAGQEGSWLNVRALGHEGWVSGEYIETTGQATTGGITGETTANVNLRTGPSTGHSAIIVIPLGSAVRVIDQPGVWLKVEALGHVGYVHGRYVELNQPALGSPTTGDGSRPELVETGRTAANLNLRTGAGTNNSIITVLPAGTQLVVRSAEGDWLQVVAAGFEGWVHRAHVRLDRDIVEEGFLKDWIDTSAAQLEPAELIAGSGRAVKAWNRFGGLLRLVSEKLAIEPETAAAVIAIESGGRGFVEDRMVIRFENHIFWDRWGKDHPEEYQNHFRFRPDKRWLGHEWRPSAGSSWIPCHKGQNREWEVFALAAELDEAAARTSVSMGLAQIMGFHYATIGYESVTGMFDAFRSGEAAQILGFFDFVQGPSPSSRLLRALQAKDFFTFAELYNGKGKVTVYGDKLDAAYRELT